jgi:hypothetical protein
VSQDLFQVGTEFKVQQNGATPATSFAWCQWVPGPLYQVPLLVDAGDQVTCILTADTSSNALSGHVTISNLTQNTVCSFPYQASSGLGLQGYCAEWIVERPTLNNVLTQLGNFGVITFTGSHCGNGTTEFGCDTGRLVSMVDDGGQTMAVAATVSADSLQITYE